MIDIKALESDQPIAEGKTYRDIYKKVLEARGENPSTVDQALDLNKKRKALQHAAETLKAEQNQVGAEVAKRKKSGEDASQLLTKMQEVAARAKDLSKELEEVETALHDFMLRLPNKTHETVPFGKGEEDNQEIRRVGHAPKFSFTPLDHIALGEKLGILDFERGSKVAGARFTFLRGAAAQLEMALTQFMLDTHMQHHGYEMMIPPFMVNSHSLVGTSQFPKFKDDVFHLEGTDYHLIPTAEVPVTNFFAGEILDEETLPQKFVAYSPCFRSEAGSYGKDTKGLIRQHQFNKVELVMFARPEESYEMHDQLVGHAERILKDLELQYRVMVLCTKDIGFGAAKCCDLEVWLPGQNAFREISSCSNFEDFQARRANIRYRPGGPKAKPQFVHTLNGSGLAVGRTLIAVLENYQNEDGSITVPKVLQKYLGGMTRIQAKD